MRKPGTDGKTEETNEKEGEEKIDDRSRAVHTGSGKRGAGTKGRREVDGHSRPRAPSYAGNRLAGAYRPNESAGGGALVGRWETAAGCNDQAHLGRNAHC